MGLLVKYLLVLLVVVIGIWSLVSRLRGPDRDAKADQARRKPAGDKPAGDKPVEMVRCAHCGLHLAAAESVVDSGQRYCSEAHRRLGPSTDNSA